jgi:predicted glycogen debranching enzyme
VVTPRIGKPVEVNALWYNALRILEALAARRGEDTARFSRLAAKVEESFRAKFVRTDGRGLYDVLTIDGSDASIRPNQVFAVSLAHSPLTIHQKKAVLQVIEEELLTPVGLRSLAPSDAAYRPCYGGSPVERDGAYHQGTVWAWLLGPFVEAHLRVHGDPAKACSILEPMKKHLLEAGVGHLSEIFDGDPPHRPDGCVAQAWSVAETLRVLRLC